MNILVTGGAGFIGSNLSDRLIQDGHKVIIADNLITGKKKNINPKCKFYELDIRDKSLCEVFEENNIDIVAHHAAQMDVRRSVAEPEYDADVNIIGSLNLLNLSVKHKVKNITFASTGGAIYGEQEYFPADEAHPLNPLSPYGVSKLAFEKYLYCYSKVYGINYVCLRYANIYGPRQDPHGEAGVVAIFCKKILEGSIPTINGDGKQTRDFTFVGDVVEANLLAINKGLRGTFNVGTGIETSVNELNKNIIELSGKPIKPVYAPEKPGEQKKSLLDSKKIRDNGWRDNTTLVEGLRKTFEYFKEESLVTI